MRSLFTACLGHQADEQPRSKAQESCTYYPANSAPDKQHAPKDQGPHSTPPKEGKATIQTDVDQNASATYVSAVVPDPDQPASSAEPHGCANQVSASVACAQAFSANSVVPFIGSCMLRVSHSDSHSHFSRTFPALASKLAPVSAANPSSRQANSNGPSESPLGAASTSTSRWVRSGKGLPDGLAASALDVISTDELCKVGSPPQAPHPRSCSICMCVISIEPNMLCDQCSAKVPRLFSLPSLCQFCRLCGACTTMLASLRTWTTWWPAHRS